MLFMVHWCIQHLDIKAAKEKREKCLIWSEGLDRAFNPWSVERTLVTQGMSQVDWFQKSKRKVPPPSLPSTENLKRSFFSNNFFSNNYFLSFWQKLCSFLHISQTSNIESNDSQNGGLEDYNIILMETFHILVPPL